MYFKVSDDKEAIMVQKYLFSCGYRWRLEENAQKIRISGDGELYGRKIGYIYGFSDGKMGWDPENQSVFDDDEMNRDSREWYELREDTSVEPFYSLISGGAFSVGTLEDANFRKRNITIGGKEYKEKRVFEILEKYY